MTSQGLIGMLCLALTGCHPSAGIRETGNYGATIVANQVVGAEAKCSAVGAPSIYECAELPRSTGKERSAAATALDAYATFQGGCYPDLGVSKCDALIEQAYAEAKRR
jgi:hypothetical protein